MHVILDQSSKFPTSKKSKLESAADMDWGKHLIQYSLKNFADPCLVNVREQWNAAAVVTAELLIIYEEIVG